MANLVKISDLAKLVGIPAKTLRYWAACRRFPTYQPARILLVDPEEFARWFDEGAKPANWKGAKRAHDV